MLSASSSVPPAHPWSPGGGAVPPASRALPKPCFAKTPCKMRAMLHAWRPWKMPQPSFSPPNACECSCPSCSAPGMCRPRGWVTAVVTAACIWQQSFGRNYKETFCPAAKNPDKICKHLNGKGEKRVNSVLSLPLEFSDAPGHSLGQSGISACPLRFLVARLTVLWKHPGLSHNRYSASTD